jgi:predicted nucleic-acid-binding Zn-ribbon protein
MKKFTKGLLSGLCIGLTISFSAIAFASQPIKLIINGREIQCDVPPQNINGRVLVPARFVAEPLGASVEWDGAKNEVRVSSQKEIQNDINSDQKEKQVYISGEDLANLIHVQREEFIVHGIRQYFPNCGYKTGIRYKNSYIYFENNETHYDLVTNTTYYSYNRLLELFTKKDLDTLPHHTF